MPKRTNDFQRLVKLIHDAISIVEGATVSESAMLPEPDGTMREVDILIERTVADVVIRVAVECRDRSRKSDVDWIDGLVGKFKNLKIDRVVAVCRLGFSKAAAAKADLNNIELRVLAECLVHDWKSDFLQLGFAAFEFFPTLNSVEITFDPTPKNAVTPCTLVKMTAQQVPSMTLSVLIHACFAESVLPSVKKFIEKEFLSKRPPLAELNRKWEFTVPVDIQDVQLDVPSNTAHKVTSMRFEVVVSSQATPSCVAHFKYGRSAMASVGTLDFGTSTGTMQVVQVIGDERLTVNFTSLAKK